jgi:nicotinamide-nucleotide adenylyltransferase
MIRAALIEDGHSLSRFMIVTVEDINKHSLWVAHVRSMSPAFDVVYTNEPLNARLFEEAGYRVEQVPLFSRDIYSSTHVREQCRTSQEWLSLVPPAVAEVIERIDGSNRLCRIHDSDT